MTQQPQPPPAHHTGGEPLPGHGAGDSPACACAQPGYDPILAEAEALRRHDETLAHVRQQQRLRRRKALAG